MAIGGTNRVKRNILNVSLVGDSSESHGEIREVLSSIAEPALEVIDGEADKADTSPGAASPDVALVVFNGNEAASLDYLKEQSATSPRPVMFALLKERSPGLMKRVIRAGADELLFMPLNAGDLTGALLKISEARWRAERARGGVVCSATSLVGGCGVSSLCMNLALALRHFQNKRVALVDLDLQASAIAVMLNLEPESTMMALARSDRKLDSLHLESALTRHSSGVYLLAAPRRIEEAEVISEKTVGAALDLMREMFDFVIVDCGDHVDERTVAAWERSEQFFYVLNQSVASIRCAWRFIDLFERLNLSTLEPRFAINRFSPNHPIGEQQVESTLGRAIFATIPSDDRAVEAAELGGRDLFEVAGGSTLAKSYEALASRVSPQPNAAPASSGLLSRFLSAFSGRA